MTRARWISKNTTHRTLTACVLLLAAASALAQWTPGLDGDKKTSDWSPQTMDDVPTIDECWDFVTAIFDDAMAPSGGGGSGGAFSLSFDEHPFCTVDETDYDRCCEPVAFFSVGNPAAGCLCVDVFLNSMGPVLFDMIEPMVGLDLDFYFWTGEVGPHHRTYHRRSDGTDDSKRLWLDADFSYARSTELHRACSRVLRIVLHAYVHRSL